MSLDGIGDRDATKIGLSRGLGRFILGAGALAASVGAASAQTAPDQPPSYSVCARLEAQLATVDRGTPDPARADLISHAEEAVAKQQADLDRLAAADVLGDPLADDDASPERRCQVLPERLLAEAFSTST